MDSTERITDQMPPTGILLRWTLSERNCREAGRAGGKGLARARSFTRWRKPGSTKQSRPHTWQQTHAGDPRPTPSHLYLRRQNNSNQTLPHGLSYHRWRSMCEPSDHNSAAGFVSSFLYIIFSSMLNQAVIERIMCNNNELFVCLFVFHTTKPRLIMKSI